jgi:hypothetical protein
MRAEWTSQGSQFSLKLYALFNQNHFRTLRSFNPLIISPWNYTWMNETRVQRDSSRRNQFVTDFFLKWWIIFYLRCPFNSFHPFLSCHVLIKDCALFMLFWLITSDRNALQSLRKLLSNWIYVLKCIKITGDSIKRVTSARSLTFPERCNASIKFLLRNVAHSSKDHFKENNLKDDWHEVYNFNSGFVPKRIH